MQSGRGQARSATTKDQIAWFGAHTQLVGQQELAQLALVGDEQHARYPGA
jgi:hypothetical protein